MEQSGTWSAAWRPIATAPKDGTRILFWNRYFDQPAIGYYRDGHIWTGSIAFQPSAMPREWEDVAEYWCPLPPSPRGQET